MKRAIVCNKSYCYGIYTIYDTGACWQVYNGNVMVGDEFVSSDAAEKYVETLLHNKDTDSGSLELPAKRSRSKTPKSCMYSKILDGKVDLSALRYVYVLECQNDYYSRKGYVRYKDRNMVVFLDRESAERTAARTSTYYRVVRIELDRNSMLP